MQRSLTYLGLGFDGQGVQGWQTSTAPDASPARVLFHLYTVLGHSKTVAKLRGLFSFVLYDSAVARVFAARDPSGQIALFQVSFDFHACAIKARVHDGGSSQG